jgi:hypothetical protein
MQQQTLESARWERLFGEFITQASALYADALTHDRPDPSKLVSLYAQIKLNGWNGERRRFTPWSGCQPGGDTKLTWRTTSVCEVRATPWGSSRRA